MMPVKRRVPENCTMLVMAVSHPRSFRGATSEAYKGPMTSQAPMERPLIALPAVRTPREPLIVE